MPVPKYWLLGKLRPESSQTSLIIPKDKLQFHKRKFITWMKGCQIDTHTTSYLCVGYYC